MNGVERRDGVARGNVGEAGMPCDCSRFNLSRRDEKNTEAGIQDESNVESGGEKGGKSRTENPIASM